jgi:hypothetical protein
MALLNHVTTLTSKTKKTKEITQQLKVAATVNTAATLSNKQLDNHNPLTKAAL